MRHHAIRATIAIVMLVAGLRAKSLYYIGNSHTDEAIGMMNVAMGFGDESVVVGRTMVPGSPLWLLYQDRESRTGLIWTNGVVDWSSDDNNLPYNLANLHWDAVVLQVFPRNGDTFENTSPAALGFAEMVYARNPDCQIFIMTSHAYAFFDDAEWAQHMGYLSTLYEPLADLITDNYPTRKPVYVIPILQVLNEVRNQVNAGTAPLLGTFESFYQEDGTDAHLEPKGLYLHALTNYATIYRDDPHGAVDSGLHYWKYPGYSVSPEFALLGQDLVWDIVTTYPASGVATTASLPRVTPRSVRAPAREHAALADLLGRNRVAGGASSCAHGVVVGGSASRVVLRRQPGVFLSRNMSLCGNASDGALR